MYGAVCLDRFVTVGLDGTSGPAAAIRERPGGEAFNTASALAGWNEPVVLAGTTIGADAAGEKLRALLAEPTHCVPHWFASENKGAETPVCTIRVFPNGERVMSGKGFARAGAPPPLEASMLQARPIFTADPHLGEAAANALRSAARARCPIVAMDWAHRHDLWNLFDVLVTSRERATRMGLDADDPVRFVAALVEGGARVAVLTRGAQGATVAARKADGGQPLILDVPAFIPPGPIVDTTGAGDTFRAGLCYGLRRAWPLTQTLRFASVAAGLHCCVQGGASRLPLEIVQKAAGKR